MYLLLRTIVTAITIFSFTAQTALACGKERWPVKVGTDAGAVSVNLKSRKATIAILGDIPTPSHPEKHLAWRYPLETKTYSIEGTIVLIKKEEDEDYHVVIKDGARTMIVEFPSPSCAGGSAFEQQIAAARAKIDAKMGGPLAAEGATIKPNWKVRVVGVGFFGRLHGATEAAPNGAELHPVLDIVFH